jgi:copper(I)-binding protein
MLMNLASHPRIGETVSVTLEFEPGHHKLTVTMPALMDSEQ